MRLIVALVSVLFFLSRLAYTQTSHYELEDGPGPPNPRGDTIISACTPSQFSVMYSGAFIWAHSPEVKHLSVSHPLSLQVEYQPDAWCNTLDAANYNQLRLGLAGGIWNFRQRGALGVALPVMFALSNRLIGGSKYHFYQDENGIHYRACAGFAYCNRPFNAKDNPKNTAFAQRLVFALQLGLVGKVEIAEQTYFKLEAGLAHLSAGAFRLPNFGLNMPYLSAGVQYNFTSNAHATHSDDGGFHVYHNPAAKKLPKFSLWAVGSIGGKQAVYNTDPISLLSTGRLEAWWRQGRRTAWVAGADAMYSQALQTVRQSLGLAPAPSWRVGIVGGHEWLIGGVSFSSQLGVYVFNPSPQIHKPIYQRYGLRFNTNGRLCPAAFLRTHYGQADGVEWSLTYRIYATHKKSKS